MYVQNNYYNAPTCIYLRVLFKFLSALIFWLFHVSMKYEVQNVKR